MYAVKYIRVVDAPLFKGGENEGKRDYIDGGV
jgi:hypothetical protein